MAIYSFRTSTYARNIYLYGDVSGTRLTTIPAEYVEPVKQYAANTFSREQIDNAHLKGWITDQEYADTLAYIPAA
jgi:hypothetical protein